MCSADERRTIRTLTELRPDQLSEAARLLESSRLNAAHYLRGLVRHNDLDDVADFLAEVVAGGADVKTWRIRDVICVMDISMPWLTGLSLEQLEKVMGAVDGSKWYRLRPGRDHWDSFPFCGAPGVLVENAPYWWRSPDSTNFNDVSKEDLEPVEDLLVGLRRWIASRIAWEVRGQPLAASVEGVISQLRASPPSRDARAAIEGLLRETTSFGNHDSVPGFRGPDALYR